VGCLEALASGSAIARKAREYAVSGLAPGILAAAEGDLDRISAALVAEAATRGDPVADAIIGEALEWLGVGMANLVHLLNPELIVIGGGLTKIGPRLFETVRRVINERAFQLPAEVVRVAPAQLGDDVGVLGAAALVLEP
jgi:glucokinase